MIKTIQDLKNFISLIIRLKDFKCLNITCARYPTEPTKVLIYYNSKYIKEGQSNYISFNLPIKKISLIQELNLFHKKNILWYEVLKDKGVFNTLKKELHLPLQLENIYYKISIIDKQLYIDLGLVKLQCSLPIAISLNKDKIITNENRLTIKKIKEVITNLDSYSIIEYQDGLSYILKGKVINEIKQDIIRQIKETTHLKNGTRVRIQIKDDLKLYKEEYCEIITSTKSYNAYYIGLKYMVNKVYADLEKGLLNHIESLLDYPKNYDNLNKFIRNNIIIEIEIGTYVLVQAISIPKISLKFILPIENTYGKIQEEVVAELELQDIINVSSQKDKVKNTLLPIYTKVELIKDKAIQTKLKKQYNIETQLLDIISQGIAMLISNKENKAEDYYRIYGELDTKEMGRVPSYMSDFNYIIYATVRDNPYKFMNVKELQKYLINGIEPIKSISAKLRIDTEKNVDMNSYVIAKVNYKGIFNDYDTKEGALQVRTIINDLINSNFLQVQTYYNEAILKTESYIHINPLLEEFQIDLLDKGILTIDYIYENYVYLVRDIQELPVYSKKDIDDIQNLRVRNLLYNLMIYIIYMVHKLGTHIEIKEMALEVIYLEKVILDKREYLTEQEVYRHYNMVKESLPKKYRMYLEVSIEDSEL